MSEEEQPEKLFDCGELDENAQMTVMPSTKVRPKDDLEKKQKIIDDTTKVRPTITRAKKERAKKSEYYIDPQVFAERVKEYYETEDTTSRNYAELGKMFLRLAKGVASSACFARYSWKDDMIGDALVKMVKALKNKKFSLQYGSSPFSYWTQICYWSFVSTLKAEKKQHALIKKYSEAQYIDSFKECEDTRNVYIKPSSDGEIFSDEDFE